MNSLTKPTGGLPPPVSFKKNYDTKKTGKSKRKKEAIWKTYLYSRGIEICSWKGVSLLG